MIQDSASTSEKGIEKMSPWVPEATRLLNPAGQRPAKRAFGPSLPSDLTLVWPAGFSKRAASGTQGKKMCASLQLFSAPSNPIPIVDKFRRSHPLFEHLNNKHKEKQN